MQEKETRNIIFPINNFSRIIMQPKVQQWHDGEKENPPTSGQYLCLVKWYGNTTHYRALANYNATTECWELSDSCEHLYWTDIPDNPNTDITNE